MNNNEKERKILVTGATGTVGSEVVKQLVSKSAENSIRAAVHSKNKADKIGRSINRGIEIVELDYMKPENSSCKHYLFLKLLMSVPIL